MRSGGADLIASTLKEPQPRLKCKWKQGTGSRARAGSRIPQGRRPLESRLEVGEGFLKEVTDLYLGVWGSCARREVGTGWRHTGEHRPTEASLQQASYGIPSEFLRLPHLPR